MGKRATEQTPRDEASRLSNPWLVATWPGLGSVASLAGAYLAQALHAEATGMIPERDFFSIDHVEVSHGIARSGRLPRSLFFTARDPRARRDLLIFLGEAQPPSGGYSLCQRILDYAVEQGVQRIVTFAAMATTMHPGDEPRVTSAVTAPELLGELRGTGIDLLVNGNISGLNGALLAAAAERGVPAMCMLGEMPYFAGGLPNPKASMAVLRTFAQLAGIEIDLEPLARQAREIEPQILRLLSQIKRAGPAPDEGPKTRPAEDEATSAAPPALDDTARRRIEELFEAARSDRSQATRLKEELDRLGAYAEYEDRFLDLFRKAD